jgi:hypothetical protein
MDFSEGFRVMFRFAVAGVVILVALAFALGRWLA